MPEEWTEASIDTATPSRAELANEVHRLRSIMAAHLEGCPAASAPVSPRPHDSPATHSHAGAFVKAAGSRLRDLVADVVDF
jgi:hypothetical protein